MIEYRVVNNESAIQWEGYYYIVPKGYLYETGPVRVGGKEITIYSPGCHPLVSYPLAEKGRKERYIGRRSPVRKYIPEAAEVASRLDAFGPVMQQYIRRFLRYRCFPATACNEVKVQQETAVVNLKERGNNNAKRKEFFDMETIIEEVYPNDPGFDKEKSRVIGYVDSILYECIPAKFIKRIFSQYNCLLDEKIYSGKAPRAPLLNSNYDGSFIAGMLQLRYIYSMPVERIVKYFAEHGFEMNKSTAHGLIKKSAWMMERLDKVLKKTILADDYLSMDESYY